LTDALADYGEWPDEFAAARVREALRAVAPPAPGARPAILRAASHATHVGAGPFLARRNAARRRAGVLVYHDPTRSAREAQLDALSRRHVFVCYDLLVECAAERRLERDPAGRACRHAGRRAPRQAVPSRSSESHMPKTARTHSKGG
jgi:hypothetical protein